MKNHMMAAIDRIRMANKKEVEDLKSDSNFTSNMYTTLYKKYIELEKSCSLKVFICTDHNTIYPPYSDKACSVVVARNEEEARKLLVKQLEAAGLDPSKGFTLREIDTKESHAEIINEGDF